jgi:hypothetical protein
MSRDVSLGFCRTWVTAAALPLMAACGRGHAAAPPPTDPRMEMVSILAAPGPHASIGEPARLWDPFVGTWDCDYTFYLDDGGIRHARGELEFGWIIDGRAIQDVWITYPDDAAKERDIGTSIRFYDPETKKWRVVFVSPAYRALTTVEGGPEGDRIVLRGAGREGTILRWSFNDIQRDSFVWRGEKSRDGGQTWRLREEHRMKRRMRRS